MAAARQGLPVRLDRAPQRGAAFALASASRRARTRSLGSRPRATGPSLIFDRPPPSLSPPPPPGPARYLVARDHRLPALRDVHLQRAAQTTETKIRDAFETVAEGWFELAEQLDWLDR